MMKSFIVFALCVAVASARFIIPDVAAAEAAEIQEILAAINNPSTDPATAAALQQLLYDYLGVADSPIHVGPVIVDETPIAPGPVIVDETPIAPGPVIVDEAPIAPGPVIVDETPIAPGPVIVDEAPIAPGPVIVDETPIAPGPVIVDEAPIAPGPVIVDESPIAPGPVIVDQIEDTPIHVGPAIIDEADHIDVSPVVVDESPIVQIPASSPLVQIIINVKSGPSVAGSPVVVEGPEPTPVIVAESPEQIVEQPIINAPIFPGPAVAPDTLN